MRSEVEDTRLREDDGRRREKLGRIENQLVSDGTRAAATRSESERPTYLEGCECFVRLQFREWLAGS